MSGVLSDLGDQQGICGTVCDAPDWGSAGVLEYRAGCTDCNVICQRSRNRSFSFEVDDLFVPNHRTYSQGDPCRESGPLYVIPRTLLFGSGFATVALGIARSALKAAIELATEKIPGRTTTVLQDRSTTPKLIGEAEASWRSASAYLRESATSVWQSACKDRALETGERIQLRLASTHAIHMAAQTVDIAYNLCGSDAIFARNPIQRQFQDIHVITQHAQGRLVHYETAGQYLLGMEPKGNF